MDPTQTEVRDRPSTNQTSVNTAYVTPLNLSAGLSQKLISPIEVRLDLTRHEFMQLSTEDGLELIKSAIKAQASVELLQKPDAWVSRRDYTTLSLLHDAATDSPRILKMAAQNRDTQECAMPFFLDNEGSVLKAGLNNVVPALVIVLGALEAPSVPEGPPEPWEEEDGVDLRYAPRRFPIAFLKPFESGEPCGDLVMGLEPADPLRMAIKEAFIR